METFKPIAASLLGVVLAVDCTGAGTETLRRQTIPLPVAGTAARFVDLDQDGRADLLVLDPVGKQLWIYRQRPSGFGATPDQALELPPQTAWITACQVEAGRGMALLLSTATGVIYYRQAGGVFETKPQTLLRADQVFTNDDLPRLISLGTNGAIPVISATEALLYRRNAAFVWSHDPPLALAARENHWSGFRNDWTLGSMPAWELDIRQFVRAKPSEADPDWPTQGTIRKLIDGMKQAGPRPRSGVASVDLNGDGRKDLLLWQIEGDLVHRTDVSVFLRGADGRWPDQPTQVLHARGIPLPIGTTQDPTPVGDLKGDGTQALVLLGLKNPLASANTLAEMVLTRGVEVTLNIRPFKEGAFAQSPAGEVSATVVLSWFGLNQWPLFICGDFNGDGRPDLVVQRTTTQWEIFASTGDRRWFEARPTMRFEVPMQGYFDERYFEIEDLDGDGRSDIVLHDLEGQRLFVFLTGGPWAKGKR